MSSNSIRGRGSASSPKNRFEPLERCLEEEIIPNSPQTQFFEDHSKTIISTNSSPDVGIESSLNPYRGCEHGCIYCYARPTHEYLGFSAGLDFESKIMIKRDAAVLLEQTLSRKNYVPKTLTLSGVTDPYQPVERFELVTRQCLKVLSACLHPVSIITKNALVLRDLDYLQPLANHQAASVTLSLTTLDPSLAAVLEPRASHPHQRLKAVQQLKENKIPVGVNLAPIIPGLNDHEIPSLLKAAKEAGAAFAGYTMVRLPYGVKDLFSDWLSQHFPDRKNKVLHRIQSLRNGKLNESKFSKRMVGEGPFAEIISQQFHQYKQRLGFQEWPTLSSQHFVPPTLGTNSPLQLDLLSI